ncbi:hypothetical protein BDR04DRAFT_779829 [Suillus decipiens]|nr:hypothetical protein BDR04DRAFT_779829 [Suillus decipiens]
MIMKTLRPCLIIWIVHVLHISAGQSIFTNLENTDGHRPCSSVGPLHELSVIFTNAEDQTRSQHKHLQYLGD